MQTKKGSYKRSLLYLFCVMALSMIALIGCSSKDNSNSASPGSTSPSEAPATSSTSSSAAPASSSSAEKPITISLMTEYFGAEPPAKDNEAIKLIEQHLGANLDITWSPSGGYTDKYTAMMAGGTLPEIVMIDNARNPAMVSAVKAGAFWDITPYVNDYPNFKKINKLAYTNSAIDGKIYGIPRERPLARDGLLVRQDWLDNLGMSLPKTIDDITNIMKAFTLDDPDKDGKNDTYGDAWSGSPEGFEDLLVYEGGPNGWEVEPDGTLKPYFMTDAYQTTLDLLRDWYKNKYVNQDYPANKDNIAPMNAGQSGLTIRTMDDLDALYGDLFAKNPKAVLTPVSLIQGPDGYRVPVGSGIAGMFMFPKSSIKTVDQLKTILAHFDKLGDPEMQNLRTWGIEGEHYKMVDGKPQHINPKQFADEIYTNLFQLKFDLGDEAMQGEESPGMAEIHQMWKDNLQYAVADPTAPLISETYTKKGKALMQIIKDAQNQYVTGAIDKDGLQKAVDQWRSGGGDQIIQEYTAAYKEVQASQG